MTRNKINARLVILTGAIMLSGCATSPITTNSAQPVPASQILSAELVTQTNGTAEVVVKRDSGMRGMGCMVRIYADADADAKPVADLWRSEKVVMYLPEGDHIISASTCGGGVVEIQTIVKAGKVNTYRVGFGVVSELGIFPTAF